LSIDEKFLNTQEKDRLQQNMAIIQMEEKVILKEILKLEHWLIIEFIVVAFVVIGVGGLFFLNYF